MKNLVNQTQAKAHYLQHERLIQKMAWSFHFTTGINFEDLLSEGNLAYAELLNSFDKDGGVKFITALHTHLKNQLINFIKKPHIPMVQYSVNEEYTSEDGYLSDPEEFDIISYSDICKNQLSTDGQLIIDIVLEFIDQFDGAPKTMRGQLIDILRKRGFSWSRVWDGMREVKEVIN